MKYQRCQIRLHSLKRTGTPRQAIHKLPRVLVESLKATDVNFMARDDTATYLINVMRMKTGQYFRAFNADGEHLCVIDDIVLQKQRKKTLVGDGICFSVVKTIRLPVLEDPFHCHLFVSPLRVKNMKKMVEMATELGVSSITPVICQNTNSKLESVDALCRLAIGATEQCERLSVPDIQEPVPLLQIVDSWPLPSRPLIVCRERSSGTSTPILKCLRDMFQLDPAITSVGLLVGPEGGFTDAEIIRIEASQGVRMVTLGDNVLRSETAVIAALSCMQNSLSARLKIPKDEHVMSTDMKNTET